MKFTCFKIFKNCKVAAATVSTSLLTNQLANKAFPLSKEFPFSSTVYNCEAVQCLAIKWTIIL